VLILLIAIAYTTATGQKNPANGVTKYIGRVKEIVVNSGGTFYIGLYGPPGSIL